MHLGGRDLACQPCIGWDRRSPRDLNFFRTEANVFVRSLETAKEGIHTVVVETMMKSITRVGGAIADTRRAKGDMGLRVAFYESSMLGCIGEASIVVLGSRFHTGFEADH